MKKLIILIMLLFTTNIYALTLPEKTNHDKVTIYVFRGTDCSHCHDLLKWFNDNIDSYSDYIEVKSYEVYKNSNNSALGKAVAERLNHDLTGLPYIVIGDNYSKEGYESGEGLTFIEKALEEYQNEDYKDITAMIASHKEGTKVQSLKEACIDEKIVSNSNKPLIATIFLSFTAFIVIIIFVTKKG